MASLGTRGLIGRMYVVDHYILLHTKYVSCWPHDFREEVTFLVFPIISLEELMTLGACQLEPQGLDWQYLCRAPLNIATY